MQLEKKGCRAVQKGDMKEKARYEMDSYGTATAPASWSDADE